VHISGVGDPKMEIPAWVLALLGWSFTLCAWGQAGSSLPPLPWWQGTQVVSNWALPPGLENLVTVVGWGDSAESEAFGDYARRRAARHRFYGRKVVGSISVFNASGTTYSDRPELAKTVILGLEGEPLRVPWEPQGGFWCNTNHPIWQDFLLEQGKRLVDAGVDAILLDELEGTVTSLFYGGSFGEPDMTLFRQYLAERYSAQELRARFGIADIATFNYGQYIRDRGLVDLWRTDRWNLPLWSDFYEFQRSANRRFAQRLIESIRQYARQTYKREIAITANLFGLYGELLEFATFLDYYTVEYPLLEHGYPPVDRTIVDYKLARGLGDRPAFVLLSVATIADLNRRPPVPNLMNLLIAESYAARGAFMTPYKTYGWDTARGPSWYEGDNEAQRPFYSFFSQYGALLDDRFSLAEVALLFSQASQLHNWAQYQYSYRGTALALLHNQTQFDVVPLGRGINLPEWPGDTRLARYRTVILPYAQCLSDLQIERLLAWVNQGGTLIAFGETGTGNLAGMTVERPLVTGWFSPGVHAYGAGKIIRLAEDLGSAYWQDRTGAVRERLASLLGPSQSVVATPTPTELVVLLDVALGGKALLAHLLNGNYQVAGDLVRDSGPFTLQVLLPPSLRSEGALQVYLLSPERSAPQLLTATRSGDRLIIPCPSTRIYDLLVISGQEAARQLAQPVLTQLQQMLEQASQARLDLSRLTGMRAEIEAASRSGNHFKAAHLARQALEELGQLRRRRILFDEAHDERNTLSPTRASQIVPEHPDWVLMSRMISTLTDEFLFETNPAALFTPELLARYDVVLMAAPRKRLTAAEREALGGFVRNGGALVVLGDCGLESVIIPITETYGIVMRRGCVLDPKQKEPGNFFTEDITDHYAVRQVPSLAFNWGGALALSDSGAVALARSGPDSWLDLNGNQRKDPDEPGGPFILAAAAEAGSGRVVVISDNCFHDDGFEWWGNDPFLRSVLRWAARPWPAGQSPAFPVLVSGASLKRSALAPEMIATAFGSEFTASPAAAPGGDLPITLGGVNIKVVDAGEREGYARIFFVSPNQVSWLVPEWVGTGLATVTITNAQGKTWSVSAEIVGSAPGLFAANGTGAGPAAANVLRVRGSGEQVWESVAARDEKGDLRTEPIVFGPEDEQLYLVLYGTGLGRNPGAGVTQVTVGGEFVPVVFAGRQGAVPGLDQINAGPLPRTLAGRGEVPVHVVVSGRQSNQVTVRFR